MTKKNSLAASLTVLALIVMPILTFGYTLAEREHLDRLCGTVSEARVAASIGLALTWPLYVSYKIFDESTDQEKCVCE